MRLLDLFAGIGGFSLAAHWMGWETAAFVEKEPFCQKVLRKNFGSDIEIHDDIFKFSGRPFRGRVDIVTGGFPCQPFSAAGKRKGRADERHLFPEMLRVISEVKPHWVVAENVRGLLSIESGSVFAEVISSLEGQGYEVITFCVPASAVEAPHRRDRLWVVAHSNADIDGHRNKYRSRHDSGSQGTAKNQAQGPNRKRLWNQLGRAGSDASNANSSGLERPELLVLKRESRQADVIVAGADRDVAGRIGRLQHDSGPHNSDNPNASLFGLQRVVGPSGEEGAESADQQLYGRDRDKARWSENWTEAATRFCRMDDGISDRVHRLKALGNSIVPGIAFEIFKAIEEAKN